MFIASLVLILVAETYFVLTTLVDFSPLNNVKSATRRERIAEVAINAPIMIVPAILVVLAAVFKLALLAWIGGAAELIIALGGVLTWWPPYLFGRSVPWATAGSDDSWPELHARTYSETIIVLPRIGDRPRPNLEHMILHSLILAGAILAFVYAATQ